MSFSARLFDLMATAHRVVIDGYDIETFKWPTNPKDEGLFECDEDNSWWLSDQVVEVTDFGVCKVTNGREYDGVMVIELYMERPITSDDLTWSST